MKEKRGEAKGPRGGEGTAWNTRAFQHHRPVTGPRIPMSEVICSWTGSRVAFSIFTRNSTNHHRSAPDHRCRSLLILSPPFPPLLRLARALLFAVVHGYTRERPDTVPSRGRQLGADTGAIASLLLGEDRRIAFTTSAQPSDPPQTCVMSESGHQLAAR